MPLIQHLGGSSKVNRVRLFPGLPRKQDRGRTIVMSAKDLGCVLVEALALIWVVENISLFTATSTFAISAF